MNAILRSIPDADAPIVAATGQALAARLQGKYADRITGSLHACPAREGRYAPLPDGLAAVAGHGPAGARRRPPVQPPGRGLGRRRRRGEHIVVVTPTASGKIAVLHPAGGRRGDDGGQPRRCTCSRPRRWRRTRSPNCWSSTAPATSACAPTFDGDTPGDARQAIRLHGDIVVSNPDMLHQAILPHHTKWAQFFENLRYVVIDEIHTYRGVFGSHVANVLRRLKRICAFYGVRRNSSCARRRSAIRRSMPRR